MFLISMGWKEEEKVTTAGLSDTRPWWLKSLSVKAQASKITLWVACSLLPFILCSLEIEEPGTVKRTVDSVSTGPLQFRVHHTS